MKKSDFKIDQTVFLIYTGSNRRHYKNPDEIIKGKIANIARKYVTVQRNGWGDKYEIETGREKTDMTGTSSHKMYLSRQEIMDEREAKKLYEDIFSKYSGYGQLPFSLEQLKKINEIIKNEQ